MARTIRFERAGGPEVLGYLDLPEANPGAHEVRIRVSAIGINRAEAMWRRDAYIEPVKFPAGLGYEAAGIVDAIGADVTGIAIDQAVNVIPCFSMNQYTTPNAEQKALPQLLDQAAPDMAAQLAFDEIAQLAAQICEAPVAFINLSNGAQLWLKACHGIAQNDVPTDHSLCDYVRTNGGRDLVLTDASQDERFRDLPCVTGEFGVRFYAGSPLLAPDGKVLGTICVLDRKPHNVRPEQIAALRTLSRQAVAQLELRHAIQLRQKETEQQSPQTRFVGV